ncbi:hypothetical protein PybrP1_005172 [[Pythium] brassicae (nom. inval.)]|nr:hypothetical protein PybrP1_005172 [[Pythium] brassicae (nom. inval.)]
MLRVGRHGGSWRSHEGLVHPGAVREFVEVRSGGEWGMRCLPGWASRAAYGSLRARVSRRSNLGASVGLAPDSVVLLPVETLTTNVMMPVDSAAFPFVRPKL